MGAQVEIEVAVEAALDAHVGDEEALVIGAAGKADPQALARLAVQAVAAGQIEGLDVLMRAARALQHRAHAVCVLVEALQRHAPFDGDAEVGQPGGQEPLVVVLRVGQHERVGAEARAHVGQVQFGGLDPFALGPQAAQMSAARADAAGDHRVGPAELAIELQGAGMDGHGPRLLRRPGLRVDDAHPHPAADQGQGEHHAGGPGAGDQDGGLRHGGLSLLRTGQLRQRSTPPSTGLAKARPSRRLAAHSRLSIWYHLAWRSASSTHIRAGS